MMLRKSNLILPDRAASRALAPELQQKEPVVGLLKAHTSSMALEGRDKCVAVNCKSCGIQEVEKRRKKGKSSHKQKRRSRPVEEDF